MSVEDSKKFVMEKFSDVKDLQISEIKADLLCKISFTFVNKPARGVFCTHLDCFSLDFFLKSMEQNLMRRWICPFCRKRCLDLRVDKYFEEIIEAAVKSEDLDETTKVFFKSDGSYIFKLEEFEENQRDNQDERNRVAAAIQANPEITDRNKKCEFEVLSITDEDQDLETNKKANNNIADLAQLDKNIEFNDQEGRLTPEILFNSENNSLKANKVTSNDEESLGKRAHSFVNPKPQRITMDKNYRHDREFLEKFWKHYEAEKKKSNKSLEVTSFEEFKKNFLTLCEQDIFFSKRVTLLYKFVLNRRKENTNATVMRYNKILDEASGQPNWIIGLNDKTSHFIPSKSLNTIFGSSKGRTDKELLKSLLDDYNFDPDEDSSEMIEIMSMRRKGTKTKPIEIM